MGLKVNFSSEEASSEARSVELLPRGEYHVKLTDVEDRECGEKSKNPGKPYWGLEFTVQEGKYENRKLWTNCMLFDGALYTFSQLMKALGYDIRSGEFEVPDGEDLVGRDMVVTVKIKPKSKGADGQEYDERNEVQGIKPWTEGMVLGATTGTAKKKSGSLLP